MNLPIGGMENHMNKTKILIAGGDMRQIFCAERLAEEYDIYTTGFDEEYLPSGTELKKADSSMVGEFDCAVLPVPPLNDRGCINTPLGGELTSADVSRLLKNGSLLFTGRNDLRLPELFPQCEVIDYMSREELCLRNAIPTAEGAVKIALEELPVTLNGLPVLIIGMGRIGTALAMILKGFGADITAAVRNATGAAKAEILGIKSVCIRDMGADWQLVFNTAPELVLKTEQLEKYPPDTLFIDLASRPGGIDFDSAAALGKKVIWALGVPGKTAPVSAGIIVAATISGILDERGAAYD